MDHIGMVTKKSLGEWNTKSTTGRPEAEVSILSVCVNDIRTVKYNTEMVSEAAGHPINSESPVDPLINAGQQT